MASVNLDDERACPSVPHDSKPEDLNFIIFETRVIVTRFSLTSSVITCVC